MSDYSKTLRLPQTGFAMRAGLPEREPRWIEKNINEHFYEKLRETRKNAKKFIVHLGPPYANGGFHMGHVLTYVLKDFIVRSKFMEGYDSPYAPGWDCHGLPIEWKVEEELRKNGQTKNDISKEELRRRCRAYAEKWVAVQKGDWQRLECLADWDHPYKTMAPANEAGIVRELGKLVQRDLVYRGLRPTLWSWAEETALAEAEVEYADKESFEIYVALPAKNHPHGAVGTNFNNGHSLVIWTTTPWTLPANKAVAFNNSEKYVGLTVEEVSAESRAVIGHTYWVAEKLAENFAKAVGITKHSLFQTLSREAGIEGQSAVSDGDKFIRGRNFDLVFEAVAHPLYKDRESKVVHGDHVTTDSGTGLVHIAPAHGQEDFLIGQREGIDPSCPVDGSGKYLADVPALPRTGVALAGKLIWPAQADILKELEETGLLLKCAKLVHSYPVSWRSKEKLIYRTTHQWFVALDKPIAELGGKTLRDASLDRIFGRGVKGVNWVPGYGANRIGSMIENRPDWCISRQRAWGVPITIFVNKKTGLPINDPKVWEHIAQLVEKEGIDAWDNRLNGREAELFPEGWLAQNELILQDLEPVRDILDVWFDSGTTHAHVLRAESGKGQRFHRDDGLRPADVYQEGSDQHRGWFHSSLLTSVANYGDAPYESVVTSGFVVDGQGRKFSKSLGNGVEPKDLLPKYGMDIIRLWVFAADFTEDIRYSPELMEATSGIYRKFRNVLRWILGNLHGTEPVQNGSADDALLSHLGAQTGENGADLAQLGSAAVAKLSPLEKYLLHRLHEVLTEARGHMDAYQFHLAYRSLYEFCERDLSGLYFESRKDALYCDAADSPRRRGAVAVLEVVLQALCTYLAPFLPFTADEAWQERYGADSSVHLQLFTAPQAWWKLDEAEAAAWQKRLAQRDEANKAIEAARAEGKVGANASARVTIPGIGGDAALLSEILAGAQVADGDALAAGPAEGCKCPRCWQYYPTLVGEVCARCDEALGETA